MALDPYSQMAGILVATGFYDNDRHQSAAKAKRSSIYSNLSPGWKMLLFPFWLAWKICKWVLIGIGILLFGVFLAG